MDNQTKQEILQVLADLRANLLALTARIDEAIAASNEILGLKPEKEEE